MLLSSYSSEDLSAYMENILPKYTWMHKVIELIILMQILLCMYVFATTMVLQTSNNILRVIANLEKLIDDNSRFSPF